MATLIEACVKALTDTILWSKALQPSALKVSESPNETSQLSAAIHYIFFAPNPDIREVAQPLYRKPSWGSAGAKRRTTQAAKTREARRTARRPAISGISLIKTPWLLNSPPLCLCRLGWLDMIPVYFCVGTDVGLLTPLCLCHLLLLGGF